MSGFLQRLVDGAAELAPTVVPALCSASPIFGFDQRIGLPGFEAIAGFDWDAVAQPVETPAPGAPSVRSEVRPVRPVPAADPDVDLTLLHPEPVSSLAPAPVIDPTPTLRELPQALLPAESTGDEPRSVARELPVSASAVSPDVVVVEAKHRAAESLPLPAEPDLPRPIADPVTRPEAPRLVHPDPAPTPVPVRRRTLTPFEPQVRAERAMLVDVARARDAEPDRAESEPRKVGELRPVLRLPAMADAPPELPPPRAEARPAPVRVVEKVVVEAPRPPRPEQAPPPKPLTAASASLIGSLEGMRWQNRIFALRQL